MTDNSYEAPASDETGAGGPARPTMLLVVAILAILLGVLGLLGSATGCFGLVTSLSGVELQQGLSSEQSAAQEVLLEAGRPFLPISGVLLLANVPLALLLIAGGGLVLASKAAAGRYLRWAFTFGLILEPLRVLLTVVQTWATWEETQAFLAITTEAASAGLPPEMADSMGGIVMASVVLGLVVSAGWMAVKIVFYVVGLKTLRREDVQEHFASQA